MGAWALGSHPITRSGRLATRRELIFLLALCGSCLSIIVPRSSGARARRAIAVARRVRPFWFEFWYVFALRSSRGVSNSLFSPWP